jgi:hypothetical protein
MASDFVELMEKVGSQNRAYDKAMQMLNNGTPNKYVGNPGIINNFQKTALTVFVSDHNIEASKYALDKGANPNQPEFWATKNAMKNWVYNLIPEDPVTGFFNFFRDCKKNKEGRTFHKYPLEIALSDGNYDITQLLLSYGAKWEFVNLNDTMFYLILPGNQSVICGKLLLEKGADPYAIVAGKTLIDFCKERWLTKNFNLLFGEFL